MQQERKPRKPGESKYAKKKFLDGVDSHQRVSPLVKEPSIVPLVVTPTTGLLMPQNCTKKLAINEKWLHRPGQFDHTNPARILNIFAHFDNAGQVSFKVAAILGVGGSYTLPISKVWYSIQNNPDWAPCRDGNRAWVANNVTKVQSEEVLFAAMPSTVPVLGSPKSIWALHLVRESVTDQCLLQQPDYEKTWVEIIPSSLVRFHWTSMVAILLAAPYVKCLMLGDQNIENDDYLKGLASAVDKVAARWDHQAVMSMFKFNLETGVRRWHPFG